MSWLFTRCFRIPGPRRVQAIALKVVRRAEHEMASSVMSAIAGLRPVVLGARIVHSTGRKTTVDAGVAWIGTP